MKINYVQQINIDLIEKSDIDYLICATGYEQRASYLADYFRSKRIKRKICLAFSDRKVLSRNENDYFFKKNEFDIIDISKIKTDDNIKIEDYAKKFGEIFMSEKRDKISILFDYSSMNTLMYASIIKYFKDYNSYINNLSLYFSYTQAQYPEPKQIKSLKFNHPIPIFDPIQTTEKKIALIIGLGYEENKALGLYEYFQNDKKDIYLFITGDEKSNKYYCDVKRNNENLIKIVNPNNIIYYDIENISPLLSTLDVLTNYLLKKGYRVVITPTGPKVFSLAALFINLLHEDITIYRLSDGNRGEPIQKYRDKTKNFIIIHLNMVKSDK